VIVSARACLCAPCGTHEPLNVHMLRLACPDDLRGAACGWGRVLPWPAGPSEPCRVWWGRDLESIHANNDLASRRFLQSGDF
jgi:hypothetical protein